MSRPSLRLWIESIPLLIRPRLFDIGEGDQRFPSFLSHPCHPLQPCFRGLAVLVLRLDFQRQRLIRAVGDVVDYVDK